MTDYITIQDLKGWRRDTTTANDIELSAIVTAASRWVDSRCGRVFSTDSTATARYFTPTNPYLVPIDDAHEITAVAVDDADDGTYSTSWSSTDWQARPVNQRGPQGQTGWPYTSIVAVEARRFDLGSLRPSVKVTAKWGWSAGVPDDVKQATLMIAARLYELRNTPLGLSGGSVEFGPVAVRDLRDIDGLLSPYKTILSSDGRFLVA